MSGGAGTGRYPQDGDDVTGVTAEGAVWLASAGTYPRSTLTLWQERPSAPVVLPCGTVFDVVSVPAIFGRRMLDRLWDEGPGSGPVAVYRGRMLLFASPGTAQRLPTLLEWEEWGSPGRTGAVPPLLCHGTGDAVTVPAVLRSGGTGDCGDSDRSGGLDDQGIGNRGVGEADGSTPQVPGITRPGSRWLVAPDTRRPWLPGPEVLLWAAVRAARASASATVRVSIFPLTDQGANVYDVSRRR